MTTAPIIRKPMPRKPPAKRLFTGMVGLPPEEPPTPASPAPVVPVAPAMPKKLGRPPKNGVAMTETERKTQSRADLKQKQHDAERRQLISALMKIYRRQQPEIMFDPKRQRRMDELRKVDRQQRRTYLAELEGLPIEKLRLAMEGKNTPDTRGRLPGERSGEGERALGQSEIERIVAAQDRDENGRAVGPEGTGPASFDRPDETVDLADKWAQRGRRISARQLADQESTDNKLRALVSEVFDRFGHCHIESRCQYDKTPCTFVAKNHNEAVEHLWAEYYRGEKLWDHVNRLSDPDIADTAGTLLIEARKAAIANIHHWVIQQWLTRYRESKK